MRIIAVPRSGANDGVRARLVEWSAAGLLDPVIWWPIGPEITGHVEVIEAGETRPDDLGPALEGHLQDVALIGLSLATPERPVDPGFAAQLQLAADRLRDVVPHDPTKPLEAVMAFAGSQLGGTFPPELFDFRTTNLLIAPEQHRAPHEPNVFVDRPNSISEHAAHALVCLSELWSGQSMESPSVLTRLRQSQGDNAVYAQVVQCYTRMVHGGYLADHIAARVLRLGDEWPNPDPVKFDRVSDASMIDPLWDYLADEYFEVHRDALGVSEFEPLVYNPKKYRLWEALKMWFSFLVARLRAKPAEWVNKTIGKIWDDSVVKWGQRLTGVDIVSWNEDDNERPQALLRRISKKPPLVRDLPPTQAWRDLRTLSIGLTDGAAIPDWVDHEVLLPTGDKRLIVSDPTWIVPDPRPEPGRRWTRQRRSACDPLSTLRAAAVPILEDASGSAEASEPVLVTTWGQASPRTSTTRSLIWRIGEVISREMLRAEAESVPPIPATPEELEERAVALEKAEGRTAARFLRPAIAVTAIAALAMGIEVWRLELMKALIAVPVTWIFWLLTVVVLALRALRRLLRRRDHDVAVELGELNAELLAAIRRSDAARLARRYDEYLDWAEIVGWVTYRPWIPQATSSDAAAAELDEDTLPASFTVGTGIVSKDRVRVLCARTRGVVFQPRWLTKVFDTVHRAAGTDFLAVTQGVTNPDAAGVALPDAAEDDDLDARSFRRSLLEDLRSGRFLGPVSSESEHQVLNFLRGQNLDDVFVGVDKGPANHRSDDDELGPTAGWLEAPAGLDELAARLRSSVVRIRCGDGAGRVSGGTGVLIGVEGIVVTNRHVVDGAIEPLEVLLDDGRVVSGKVLRRSDSTDLALVELDTGSYPSASLSDAPVRLAQPVVTMGHPLLLEGDPTVTFGIVGAAVRTITMQGLEGLGSIEVLQLSLPTAPGASGSPVFDLRGNVVGIICAGRDRDEADPAADYMSFAVPASQVAALLKGVGAAQLPSGDAAVGALMSTQEFLCEIRSRPETSSFLPDHWRVDGNARRLPAWTWGEQRLDTIGSLRWDLDLHRPARVAVSVGLVSAPAPLDELPTTG
jgi:S1-C subfamily serine protease